MIKAKSMPTTSSEQNNPRNKELDASIFYMKMLMVAAIVSVVVDTGNPVSLILFWLSRFCQACQQQLDTSHAQQALNDFELIKKKHDFLSVHRKNKAKGQKKTINKLNQLNADLAFLPIAERSALARILNPFLKDASSSQISQLLKRVNPAGALKQLLTENDDRIETIRTHKQATERTLEAGYAALFAAYTSSALCAILKPSVQGKLPFQLLKFFFLPITLFIVPPCIIEKTPIDKSQRVKIVEILFALSFLARCLLSPTNKLLSSSSFSTLYFQTAVLLFSYNDAIVHVCKPPPEDQERTKPMSVSKRLRENAAKLIAGIFLCVYLGMETNPTAIAMNMILMTLSWLTSGSPKGRLALTFILPVANKLIPYAAQWMVTLQQRARCEDSLDTMIETLRTTACNINASSLCVKATQIDRCMAHQIAQHAPWSQSRGQQPHSLRKMLKDLNLWAHPDVFIPYNPRHSGEATQLAQNVQRDCTF